MEGKISRVIIYDSKNFVPPGVWWLKVIKYYSQSQAPPGLQILKVIKYYKSHAQAHAAGGSSPWAEKNSQAQAQAQAQDAGASTSTVIIYDESRTSAPGSRSAQK